MGLITVDDVIAETRLTISGTTRPSEDDVAQFIKEIEAEVRSHWAAAGGSWPAAGSDAAEYLSLTEKLGVKVRCYETKFALASGAMTPEQLAAARLAYNDRLKGIPAIILGTQPTSVAGLPGQESEAPAVVVGGQEPTVGISFDTWTRQRVRQSYRTRGGTPWW